MPVQRRLPVFATGSIKALAGAFMMAAILAGCALQPPRHPNPMPSPPVIHPPPTARHPSKAGHTQPSCAWTQVHGVAKLIRIQDRHSWYRFYPGNTAVAKKHHPANANPGDEFTAILKQPLNGPCKQPGLVLVKPLP